VTISEEAWTDWVAGERQRLASQPREASQSTCKFSVRSPLQSPTGARSTPPTKRSEIIGLPVSSTRRSWSGWARWFYPRRAHDVREEVKLETTTTDD
jgi:hypothetical protein